MSFKIVDVEPNSFEHFEFRKGKIGSSDASSIMGENPWETPLGAWERIVFEKKVPTTRAMERGTEMEPIARKWINDLLGVYYRPVIIQSTFYSDLIASLDGFYQKDGINHLLEIKCPGVKTHQEAIEGRIPKHYEAQLQHQMALADVDFMYYLSFDGVQGKLLPVYRDKEYCTRLIRAEMNFLQSIEDFKSPQPSDKDWVEITDSEHCRKAERLLELRILKSQIEEEEENLTSALKETLPHPRCRIGDLRVLKTVKKGTIDYSKIDALKGVNLENYRKEPVTYWTFSKI